MSLTRRAVLTSGGVATAAAMSSISSGCAADPEIRPDGRPVRLELWDYAEDPGSQYLERLSSFTEKTGIRIDRVSIKYEDFIGKILQATTADRLPDIILGDNPWVSSFADQGVIADLSKEITDWGQWKHFYPGPRASATWESSRYGVPNESNCLIMYYDADYLKDRGVSPPSTWGELMSSARDLTTRERYGFATSMTRSENSVFVFECLLWQAGGDILDLDSPAGHQAMTVLKQLVDNGWMSKECLSWDLRGGVSQLAAGKAAIAYGGTWDLNWLNENAQSKIGVALLPAGSAGATSCLGGEVWTVSVTCPFKAEAWDLIRWVTDLDNLAPSLVEDGQLPSRSDMARLPAYREGPLSTAVEQLKLAKARVYGPRYPRMADAIMTCCQNVLSGQESIDTALRRAAGTIADLT